MASYALLLSTRLLIPSPELLDNNREIEATSAIELNTASSWATTPPPSVFMHTTTYGT